MGTAIKQARMGARRFQAKWLHKNAVPKRHVENEKKVRTQLT